MRIVAYNMRMGGSERHWKAIDDAFTPEVILAQECLAPPVGVLPPGATALWSAVPRNRWGSALVLYSGTAVPVEVPGYEGWVVAADVEWTGRPLLRIVSVHVPSGRGRYLRIANDILDRLAHLPGRAELLLGGDFNVTVARRQPGESLKNSRGGLALLERLEAEFGLLPAWEVANPDSPLPQTLRWTGDASVPYHCDGVFLPKAWVTAGVGAEVASGGAWDRLSDHNPVAVSVTMPLAR